MTHPARVAGLVLRDTLRSRWLVAQAVFFLLVTEALFRLSGSPDRAALTLSYLIILLVPLFGLLFGITYYYNSREFIELLLVQPLRRSAVYSGTWAGLSASAVGGLAVGMGIPLLLRLQSLAGGVAVWLLLLLSGVSLAVVFIGVAFLIATYFNDKSKGISVAILFWLLSAVAYDGLVLLIINSFAEYPLERPVLALCLANPIDLVRVLLLTQLDASALLGVTGAVFRRFFGGGLGIAIATGCMILWAIVPYVWGLFRFRRLDF